MRAAPRSAFFLGRRERQDVTDRRIQALLRKTRHTARSSGSSSRLSFESTFSGSARWLPHRLQRLRTLDTGNPARGPTVRQRLRPAIARRPHHVRNHGQTRRAARRRATAPRRPCASNRPVTQRGSGSPGYHLPCLRWITALLAKRSRIRCRALRPAPLVFPQRCRVPFVAFHVVDRHESRLAAHGQAHVAGRPARVDGSPSASTACHCSSL